MITLGNILYIRDENNAFIPVMGASGGSGGLTTEQINALDGMFALASYSSNPRDAYATFRTAFNLGSKYNVMLILSGCDCNNPTILVAEGEAYNATLTAQEGYTLDGATVNITMGGVDITSDVYEGGVITIDAVTGDVTISVEAVEVSMITEIIPDIAVETKENTSVVYDGNLTGSTAWRINGVKAGDVIVTGDTNGVKCFASGEWSGRTIYNADDSQIVKEFMDTYGWAKYTFTAAQDYDVFWVSSRTSFEDSENSPSYSTDIITWTHAK